MPDPHTIDIISEDAVSARSTSCASAPALEVLLQAYGLDVSAFSTIQETSQSNLVPRLASRQASKIKTN
jgi:hypothetical protein